MTPFTLDFLWWKLPTPTTDKQLPGLWEQLENSLLGRILFLLHNLSTHVCLSQCTVAEFLCFIICEEVAIWCTS